MHPLHHPFQSSASGPTPQAGKPPSPWVLLDLIGAPTGCTVLDRDHVPHTEARVAA